MTIGIFGDTQKIPDPRFVYQTTYPNRFRGSYWAIPRFGLPFVRNPTWGPPFAGLGGCGCGDMEQAGGGRTEDFAGLGALVSQSPGAGLVTTLPAQAPPAAPPAQPVSTFQPYTPAVIATGPYAPGSLPRTSQPMSTGTGMLIGAGLVGAVALAIVYSRKRA